jgi:outer membrane protein assembly factor BamB
MAAAVAAAVSLAACGSVAAGNGSPSTVAVTVKNCGRSVPVQPLPVLAVGIDWQGNVCWETSVTGPPPSDLFHSSSSPQYDDGTAILSSDGQVIALSPVDGHRLWMWDSGAQGVNSDGYGPGGFLIDTTDGVVVATTKDQGYVGLDVKDGVQQWTRSGTSSHDVGPLPSGQGSMILAYPTGQVSELFDIHTGHVVWHDPQTTPSNITSGAVSVIQVEGYPPVVADTTIVSPQTDHSVSGVSLATGQTVWTDPGPVLEAVAAGNVAILTPPPGTHPAPYDISAYAVDSATGHKLWSYGPFDPGAGRFEMAGQDLLYTNTGIPAGPAQGQGIPGRLTRVDPDSGRDLWSVSTAPFQVIAAGDEIVSLESPIFSAGSDTEYSLVGRDAASGRTLWSTADASGYSASNQLLTIPSPDGDLVIVLDRLDVSAFSAETGRKLWTVALPNSDILDGVVAAGSGLVVQTSDSQYQLQGH